MELADTELGEKRAEGERNPRAFYLSRAADLARGGDGNKVLVFLGAKKKTEERKKLLKLLKKPKKKKP